MHTVKKEKINLPWYQFPRISNTNYQQKTIGLQKKFRQAMPPKIKQCTITIVIARSDFYSGEPTIIILR
jgi:hypothetical protein